MAEKSEILLGWNPEGVVFSVRLRRREKKRRELLRFNIPTKIQRALNLRDGQLVEVQLWSEGFLVRCFPGEPPLNPAEVPGVLKTWQRKNGSS